MMVPLPSVLRLIDMIYKNIKPAIFIDRPNRFIANVCIDGKTEVCHVKNTGRCRELLIPGARVFVQQSDNPNRRTKYDLIAVYKDDILINIDSQAPNKVFGEWLQKGGYFADVTTVKPECKFGDSRLDFYFEYGGRCAFAEVKGVTLERDGVFLFPDAPTERGVKHLKELCRCVDAGFDAYAVFVIQAEAARYFTPNNETHPAFADALKYAAHRGVKILCLCCNVTPESLEIKEFVSTQI